MHDTILEKHIIHMESKFVPRLYLSSKSAGTPDSAVKDDKLSLIWTKRVGHEL